MHNTYKQFFFVIFFVKSRFSPKCWDTYSERGTNYLTPDGDFGCDLSYLKNATRSSRPTFTNWLLIDIEIREPHHKTHHHSPIRSVQPGGGRTRGYRKAPTAGEIHSPLWCDAEHPLKQMYSKCKYIYTNPLELCNVATFLTLPFNLQYARDAISCNLSDYSKQIFWRFVVIGTNVCHKFELCCMKTICWALSSI